MGVPSSGPGMVGWGEYVEYFRDHLRKEGSHGMGSSRVNVKGSGLSLAPRSGSGTFERRTAGADRV